MSNRYYSTPAESMRKYMNLFEAGLVPNKDLTIRIDPDVYKLMRALLFISNPDSYVDNNPHGDSALMVFNDPISYNETKKKLKAFGIPFYDDTPEDMKTCDGELMPQQDNNVSPYPKKRGKSTVRKVKPKKL